MHSYPSQGGGVVPLLIALGFIAIALLRNARARRLRVERLWIAPLLILLAAVMALGFGQQHAPRPLMIGVYVLAAAAGAAMGWWRGRFTQITVDPQTHELTSRASPIGMVLILAIFAIRMGLRTLFAQNASALHVSVIEIGDAFLLLAVGLVCAQRLEIALRATRLLNEARAARTA
jgi:hypothetical protein